jgi:hypothetical protein
VETESSTRANNATIPITPAAAPNVPLWKAPAMMETLAPAGKAAKQGNAVLPPTPSSVKL